MRRLLAVSATINEFPVPTAFSKPIGIVTGPDGNLWFTELGVGKVATINPTTHAVVEFPLPGSPTGGPSTAGPYTITVGSDGNLWFTEYNGGAIGTINPTTHAISEFPVPTRGSLPLVITPGPDGNLWFTEQSGNNIGMINPKSHAITEFPVPTQNANLQVITPGPDGNLWFAEFNANQIGRINPTTHAITEFPVLAGGSGPSGITAGPDGNLWFTSVNSNSIGTVNPQTLAFTNNPLPGQGAFLANIIAGPDGNLAFTEFSGNNIGQINPTTRLITETPIPTPNSGPNPITVGPDGNLWFGERTAGQIGQLVLPTPTADLSVSLSASPEPVAPGGLLTYTIAVANLGPDPAQVVSLADALPPGTTFVSSTSPAGWKTSNPPQGGTGTFASSQPNLASGTLSTFTLVVRVSAGASDGSTIANTAGVLSETFDPNPRNRTAQLTSRVAATVPLSFVVTNTDDAGRGSLRQAILNANQVGGHLITFAIPAARASVQTISPTSPLPVITGPTTIDGTSQAVFLDELPPGPLVQVDGRRSSPGSAGLVFAPTATNSSLLGLSIFGFQSSQVELDSAGDTVQGNFIGFASDPSAGGSPSALVANPGSDGLLIRASNAKVGGLGLFQRNVISGNLGQGIEFASPSASGAIVSGNYIGTDPTGTVALPNRIDGIVVEGGAGRELIGPENVISGNGDIGVELLGAAGVTITGNFVGTDYSGTKAIGNASAGICVDAGSTLTTIGGYIGGANLISGNGQVGVAIQGGSSQNQLTWNLIGLDTTGSLAIGNGIAGILISESPSNVIGPYNVVSGNGTASQGAGIWVEGVGSSGNVVSGNRVGTDTSGEHKVGNAIIGVLINEAAGNLIGTSSFGTGNLVSGNSSIGVMLAGAGATGNVVQGNLIGTNAEGTSKLGNGGGSSGAGVYLENAPRNVIGGPMSSQGNVISGNGFDGLYAFGPGSSGNTIQGNEIGTDSSGSRPLGNGNGGIVLNGSARNRVVGNLIDANARSGITVSGTSALANNLSNNSIGVGIGGQPLGNGGFGILIINQAAGTVIGPNLNAYNALGPIRDTTNFPAASSTSTATSKASTQAKVAKIEHAKAKPSGHRPFHPKAAKAKAHPVRRPAGA